MTIENVYSDMLLYGKKTGANAIFVTTNVDPHGLHEAHGQFPIWELGIPAEIFRLERGGRG